MINVSTHFSDIRELLQRELSEAKTQIRVAVAWFTDQELYKILLEKATNNVDVIVLIRNDEININANGIDWQGLVDAANGALYVSKGKPHLHHKFCIVDDKRVISGSYNWTYAASRNHENVVVTSLPTVSESFRQEHKRLIDCARQVESVSAMAIAYPPIANDFLRQEAEIEIEFKHELQQNDDRENKFDELIEQANAAYLKKDYVVAEKISHEAIALKQDGVAGYELLSTIYWRTEQFLKSLEAAKRAEAYGVNNAELWNGFGLAFHGQRKFREAIEYFNRSIDLEPEISTWHHNKCEALLASGSEKLADKVALETIRLASNTVKSYKKGDNDHRVLRAHIERANLRIDLPEVLKDARAAHELFLQLPLDEQDLHDLDDINKLLKLIK